MNRCFGGFGVLEPQYCDLSRQSPAPWVKFKHDEHKLDAVLHSTQHITAG